MTKTEIQKHNYSIRQMNKRNEEKMWKAMEKDPIAYPEKQFKKCPSCGKNYTEHPALSRKDNKTEICPECGIEEAILDLLKNVKYNKKFIY